MLRMPMHPTVLGNLKYHNINLANFQHFVNTGFRCRSELIQSFVIENCIGWVLPNFLAVYYYPAFFL